MKKIVTATTLILSAVCSMASLAAEGDVGVAAAMDDRYCTTCHGVEGIGNIAIEAPRLAGMEAWYLKRQLENFRAGIRGTHEEDVQGIAMRPMAAKLSDESIADIVDWVGDWEYVPAEATVEGNVRQGRTAFQACAACHGANAQGNEALGAPALAGQNDWYLLTQLRNFRAGFRGSHQEDTFGSQMVTMSKTLTDDQAVIDVVSYINTL
ncbi:MAG: c-type cytochrome [Pseudomonadales bacterium]|tara:strand:+ start:1091 stop:1717 length:627 start_codon:yes stop_codon:yes gene_type:complete